MDGVETERLKFRRLCADDADTVYRLYNTPGFKRFVAGRHIDDLPAARAYIAAHLAGVGRRPGLGLHIVERKSTATPIGVCGLIKRDTLPNIDLGYGLFPRYEGQGYALEAAHATVDFARQQLGVHKLVAIATSDNARSISLLAKLGFRFTRVQEQLPDGVALNLYEISP